MCAPLLSSKQLVLVIVPSVGIPVILKTRPSASASSFSSPAAPCCSASSFPPPAPAPCWCSRRPLAPAPLRTCRADWCTQWGPQTADFELSWLFASVGSYSSLGEGRLRATVTELSHGLLSHGLFLKAVWTLLRSLKLPYLGKSMNTLGGCVAGRTLA